METVQPTAIIVEKLLENPSRKNFAYRFVPSDTLPQARSAQTGDPSPDAENQKIRIICCLE